MEIFTKKTIYLDYAAATPCDPAVLKVMKNHESHFANASAIHSLGVSVSQELEAARAMIAQNISAHADEIIFTGSGTESDALAIMGVVRVQKTKDKNFIPHIITTLIEHPAVLENCRLLEKNGEAEVTYIAIDEEGLVDPKDIRDAIKDNTVLVSCMYANNEIGTIQPIMEIAKAIRHYKKTHNSHMPLFHTDACQAMNYLFTENIEKLGVDLLSFNSSKIYGPKGVGILYKKRGIELAPLYAGGGQESNLRSGTENTVSIIGAAHAFENVILKKQKEAERLTKLRDHAIKKILALSDTSGYTITLNGSKDNRLPNNINISIDGISSELLVIELDAKKVFVSAKSACKSDDPDESYVIGALRDAQGKVVKIEEGSLRVSLGQQTCMSDIDAFTESLAHILQKYKNWK